MFVELRAPASAGIADLVRVSAPIVRVPGNATCSSDFPMACMGSTVTGRSSFMTSMARSRMPRLISMSTEQGKCGPCCSIAET